MNMLMSKQKITATLVAVAMVGLNVGCAKNNLAGEHTVNLQFGSYTTASHKILRWLLPSANASVSSLKMCFKRLRFKTAEDSDVTADPANDSDNVDFKLGEIDVSSGATSLGAIKLAEGDYTRLEFDLESDCASGKSISLVNSNGSFSTNQRITIKFSGHFTANSDGTLNLGVQQILDALNTYNGSVALKNTAESISGVLSN